MRKQIQRLQEVQKTLLEPARGGRIAHRKRIQGQYAKKKARMKLYKCKKVQRKAIKTGKLKQRK